MTEPSEEAIKSLQSTHAAGFEMLRLGHHTPEGLEIAVEVERHRWYWKPRRPRLLLVAESHVHTTQADLGSQLDTSKIKPFLRPSARALPDRFVRFVYCLGYGESELLLAPSPTVSNPGTPGYWDIFGRVTLRTPQPRQADGASLEDRMRWKIDTLRGMYRMGIWLLDASVHAVYLRNDCRLPNDIQHSLHQQWWRGYGSFLLNSCASAKVWVIGKTVSNHLTGLPGWRSDGWIYQPNATDVDPSRNWLQLIEDCRQLQRTGSHDGNH